MKFELAWSKCISNYIRMINSRYTSIFVCILLFVSASPVAQNSFSDSSILRNIIPGSYVAQNIVPRPDSAQNLPRPDGAGKKPNIIFIFTDDLGYGDIGVFFQNQRKAAGGNSTPYALTPAIDGLAHRGARFTNQYCNAPVCAPSRASLLTGIHQGNATVRNNQFDKALENNHTIATVLKEAGYATIAIGKWGLQGVEETGPEWPAHPLKRGFDNYFGYIRHRDGHEHYPYEGKYRGKKEVYDNYTNIGDQLAKCYTTDLWTAKAKQWIIDHHRSDPASPFFMYLAYDAPHAVLELPTQEYPSGGGLKGGLQWLNEPGRMINTATGEIDSYIFPDYREATYDHDQNPNTAQVPWPETYQRYATSTRRIDDAVGDIVQLLRDLKLEENTMVIFTSDNGPSIESYLPDSYVMNSPVFFESYGPFDGIKRDVWEGGLRVPTVVSWPSQIPAGRIINSPSMLSDWLATFADIGNVPAPARTDGVSLLPSMTGKGKQEEGLVYVEYFEGGKTPDFKEFEASRRNRPRKEMQLIRQGDLVGVRYNVQSAADDFEIYDVAKDPKQSKNLSGTPGVEGLQDLMKSRVLQVRHADSAASRPYDNALIPSVQIAESRKKGWERKFYTGDFPWVVSVNELNISKSNSNHLFSNNTSENTSAGVESGNELERSKSPEIKTSEGLVAYTAYIRIPADGKYSFSFQSPSKAFVRLHEAAFFDADFGYRPGAALTKEVFLKAGYHPISIYLLKNSSKDESIVWKWKKPGSEKWKTIRKKDLVRKQQILPSSTR